MNFEKEIMKAQRQQELNMNLSIEGTDENTFMKSFRETLYESYDRESFEKAWSKDLQSKYPSGGWRTINGAKVFINNGKVIAGLDGFNGAIDKFFEEKKKGSDSKSISKDSLDKIKKDVKNMSVDELRSKIDEISKIIDSEKTSGSDRVDYMLAQTKLMSALASKAAKGEKSSGNEDITLDTFKDIAKQSKNVEEFIDKVQKVKNVPPEVSEQFREKYGKNKTIQEAALRFLKEHGGKKGFDSNKYKSKISSKVKDALDGKFNVTGKNSRAGLPLKGIKEIYTDEEYKGKKVNKQTSKDAEKLLDYAKEGDLKGIKQIKEKYFSEWNKSKSQSGTQRNRYVPIDTAKVEIYNIANAMHQEGLKSIKEEKDYYQKNKDEIKKIIDDDPFISIRDAVKEHKESAKKGENNEDKINSNKSIKYTVKVEEKYNKRYNEELESLGSQSQENRIRAASKVYDGKTFTNGDVTYNLSVNKNAKREADIVTVEAKKDFETQNIKIAPSSIPFYIG